VHTDWLLLRQIFNEAERRWAETMERIARQQHSADLLAMAAEALMIPEAWNLKQVQTSCSMQHLPVSRDLEIVPRCQSALRHKKRLYRECHCLFQT
jgi:dUTPase